MPPAFPLHSAHASYPAHASTHAAESFPPATPPADAGGDLDAYIRSLLERCEAQRAVGAAIREQSSRAVRQLVTVVAAVSLRVPRARAADCRVTR
jgi:hypothetical protein